VREEHADLGECNSEIPNSCGTVNLEKTKSRGFVSVTTAYERGILDRCGPYLRLPDSSKVIPVA